MAPKGMVFNPFWSAIGYISNHLGLKSGKLLYTLWIQDLELDIFFSRHYFFVATKV